MDFKLIVTVGPALMQEDILKDIHKTGPCIYRINGAHTDATMCTTIIKEVRRILPDALFLVDLPGNKIRTAQLTQPICLKKDEPFCLYSYQVNWPEFLSCLCKGDKVLANDSIYEFEVRSVTKEKVELLSKCNGMLLNNKGLHVAGKHHMIPFLFKKDKELIQAAAAQSVDYIGLSFVRTLKDVEEAKEALAVFNYAPKIISKIETKAAVKDLKAILTSVEHILVDRGDLSTEVGMVELPSNQAYIIKTALAAKKNIFLATQFLRGMQDNPVPYIAEAIDLYNTIKQGIYGIQLSEETAIGSYPRECVRYVYDLVAEVAKNSVA